jgi:hypothetical protein
VLETSVHFFIPMYIANSFHKAKIDFVAFFLFSWEIFITSDKIISASDFLPVSYRILAYSKTLFNEVSSI